MHQERILKLEAVKVSQPLGEFFTTSIKAKDLIDMSFADVRRLEERDIEKYLGIQRPLSKKRVKEIRDYIERADATFPTAIILAIDEKCAEYNEETKSLTLYPYNPVQPSLDDEEVEFDKIAKVIDGQHRIAAFLDDNNNYRLDFGREFELNVSIFIGIDVSEQANIFATVNLAQTKVNKSLVYDLEDLSSTRSPHKTCHLIAVALDADSESPLYQRVKRLGVATPGRLYEPLTQAVVVESLVKFISVDPFRDRKILLDGKKLPQATIDILHKCPFRNMFLEGKDEDIYRILFNYFKAVERRWPNAWADLRTQGNLLPKSNSFRALMKFLKDRVYVQLVGEEHIGQVPTVEQFLEVLIPVSIKDEDFTTRNFEPGSGGQAKFYKLLAREQV